jgi:hypothetical protein
MGTRPRGPGQDGTWMMEPGQGGNKGGGGGQRREIETGPRTC